MEPETVLIVSDFANINGGQAKVAIDSAVLLAEAGLNVIFFAGSGEPDHALDHPRIRVEGLGQRDIATEPNRAKAAMRGLWNAPAARALWALANSLDPARTVLHAHGYAKVLSPAIGPVFAHGPLAAVFTMHDYFLACPNGGFYDYQRGEICTRHAMGAGCLSVNCDHRHPAHKAWRVLRQMVTAGPASMPRGLRDVIYISQSQRRLMAPYLGADTRLHHVPNPVSFGDTAEAKTNENRAFVFVGRLDPEKGGLMFARAAKSAGLPAVFVGDGPEAGAIRAANPEAVLTGWLPAAEVRRQIGGARALVMPSLWAEPFGLVAHEALGLGVPVVAGHWTAVAEAIVDGVDGALFDSATVPALAKALTRAQALGPFDAAPHRQAVSPSLHLDRLLAVYRRALGPARAG